MIARSRKKHGLRVGTMLVALAALPVLALSLFAGNQIGTVTETQRDLVAIDDATADLTDLINLETALDSETYWAEGTAAIEAYGIGNDFVAGFLSIDIEANLADAQRDVDAALVKIGNAEIDEAVANARLHPNENRSLGQSSLNAVNGGIIANEISETSEELLALASGLPDGDRLMHRAETLTESNLLRSRFNRLLHAYFLLIVYGGEQPREALLSTGAASSGYRDALAEFEDGLETDGEMSVLFAELVEDDSVNVILDASAAAIETFDQQSAASLDFTNSGSLVSLAETLGSATQASDIHLDLVLLATEELRVELQETRNAERQRAFLLGGGTIAVILTTVLALFIVTRSIVGPIRRLGQAAEAISTGERLPPVELAGPAEVRAATQTLNQASLNLHRAEAQALALADGRLDDVSFDEAATGSIGRSLDVAVGRLRSSLTEREDFRRRLAHEATHDGLTGLQNRRAAIAGLNEALERCAGTDGQLAVLFIDLDGFKGVNDTYGHGAGDQLLNVVAERLQASCRPSDRVGRLGGDEFLLVAEPVESPAAAFEFAERIRTVVSSPIDYDGRPLVPTVSIGVAVAGCGSYADEVIREADFAVYEAKNAGRNQTRLFDEPMRARLLEEADLSDAIAEGLERGEFHLSFQPIVVAADRSIHEFEALIRWTRPGFGNVPPDDFIEFAEQSDLIIDIDRWVLDEGARHLAQFTDWGNGSETRIAVNISGRHLLRGDLYGDVKDTLDRWKVEPSRLTIEITESALLDDLAAAAETLKQIRSLGIRIAIDDFGTGYTSLGHLRDLPADVLKIDRSFTQNLYRADDISLVRLVTETGHLLGMSITVEGVETAAQERLLAELGVDYQQGFWFGRPAPYDALRTNLSALPA